MSKRDINPATAYIILERDWQKVVGITPQILKDQIVAEQIEQLVSFKTGLGSSALTVVDLEKNQYLYVDDRIEMVTGLARELYLRKGPRHIMTHARLSQIPRIISSTIHQRKFFGRLKPDEYERYIVNREFCYKPGKVGEIWVLHQVFKHLKNPMGKIFAIASLQTNINAFKFDSKFRYYIYDRMVNQIIHPKRLNPVDIRSKVLSSREKEIIELLAIGWNNNQVADKLNISYHTVRTHRKNIFKKLNCSNIVELIQLIK
ncbi:hypothetical protein C5O00_05580 [Pukyongia salina]|uniref:HTH luxR-type domain-containing protein n=1 Tax=Pukyongia salina TaxID=2094025 RepID=A0A2S0HVI0_9FLAO|nr:helix-turn-helix transcriptional regulator [Pukyongia salina]AVI50669.1 hypothetical protein C5O00_05580 [Pukyongia salina]